MAPRVLIRVLCWLCLYSVHGQDIAGNLTGPAFLVTDGTRNLTLTCQVSGTSKVYGYLWATPGKDTKRCETTQASSVCTFQPRLDDDNQNVACAALLDPIGETILRSFYQVNLTYPPPSLPSLTQTNTAQQGDVITCKVSGGKPRVTNVTFHCQHPDHADREDDVSDDGTTVISSIRVNTSQASNQSMLCSCSAHWDPEPGLYNETIYKEFILGFSEPLPDTASLAVIGGVSGAVAVVVVIVLTAVVMWRYRRRKRINSKQSTTIGDKPQTNRQQQRQRRSQQISRQQDQQQPHDVAAAVLEGSHTTSQHADIGNPYDVLQPGQDDGRTYTELMTSSTADDGTYLHPVNGNMHINSRQNATVGENPQTTRQQRRQQSRGKQQSHGVSAAMLEGSHTTSQHADIGNAYDVLQPGQDDGRTYTELMTSSTADDGTYLHPVNDDYEIPASQ